MNWMVLLVMYSYPGLPQGISTPFWMNRRSKGEQVGPVEVQLGVNSFVIGCLNLVSLIWDFLVHGSHGIRGLYTNGLIV